MKIPNNPGSSPGEDIEKMNLAFFCDPCHGSPKQHFSNIYMDVCIEDTHRQTTHCVPKRA